MYSLAECIILRNEERYIEERLEFALLQGVEHFFLYINKSLDRTLPIILNYERQGLATVVDCPVEPCQFEAYNNCLKRFGDRAKWIAFVDADEFLYSPTIKGLQKAIEIAAARSKFSVGGIAAHWLFFGSNGEKEYDPDKLVIERYTKRAKQIDRHVKSIVRPSATICVGKDPHHFIFKTGYYAVDENGKKQETHYALSENGTGNLLRVAHFHTKSYGEYMKRKIDNPDPGSGKAHSKEWTEEMFKAHDLNDITDLSLKRFIKQIKQNITDRRRIFT